MKNVIEFFLEQLEVKYTHSYASKLYDEHPHKYNMFGLIDILHSYNLNAIGIKVKNNNYTKLSFPCILHIKNGFVVALKLNNRHISYYWNGNVFCMPLEKFNAMWTGNAIVIDGDSDASEPYYITHLNEERVGIFKKALCAITLLFILILALFKNCNYYNSYSILFIFLDFLGIILCALLIGKQLHIKSRISDKVCSLFHQKDCFSVLSSEKATFFGLSWSEIGLSFFVANLLSLILAPYIINELSNICILAIAYAFWSIYYQWRVVRQWCVLCLSVQCVIFLMACLGIFKNVVEGFYFNILNALAFFSSWYFIIIVFDLWIKYEGIVRNRLESLQSYKALKSNKTVFQALLTSERYCKTGFEDSNITFGNKNAKMLITILTNPHCNPCARTHVKIDELLSKYKEKLCVQYVFSAFNTELKDSNRLLIAIWQQMGEQDAIGAYSQWYREGKYHAHDFINKWKEIDIYALSVENELKRHEKWIERTGYTATPTILVNGYELPEEYDIEDIPMILD